MARSVPREQRPRPSSPGRPRFSAPRLPTPTISSPWTPALALRHLSLSTRGQRGKRPSPSPQPCARGQPARGSAAFASPSPYTPIFQCPTPEHAALSPRLSRVVPPNTSVTPGHLPKAEPRSLTPTPESTPLEISPPPPDD